MANGGIPPLNYVTVKGNVGIALQTLASLLYHIGFLLLLVSLLQLVKELRQEHEQDRAPATNDTSTPGNGIIPTTTTTAATSTTDNPAAAMAKVSIHAVVEDIVFVTMRVAVLIVMGFLTCYMCSVHNTFYGGCVGCQTVAIVLGLTGLCVEGVYCVVAKVWLTRSGEALSGIALCCVASLLTLLSGRLYAHFILTGGPETATSFNADARAPLLAPANQGRPSSVWAANYGSYDTIGAAGQMTSAVGSGQKQGHPRAAQRPPHPKRAFPHGMPDGGGGSSYSGSEGCGLDGNGFAALADLSSVTMAGSSDSGVNLFDTLRERRDHDVETGASGAAGERSPLVGNGSFRLGYTVGFVDQHAVG